MSNIRSKDEDSSDSRRSRLVFEEENQDQDDDDDIVPQLVEVVSGAPPRRKQKVPHSDSNTDSTLPYDPDHASNSLRIRIQDIMNNYDQHGYQLTSQDITDLKPAIQEWVFKRGYHRSHPVRVSGRYPYTLVKLNEQRRRILSEVGHPTTTKIVQPLQRELLGNPTLAKYRHTHDQLLSDKEKFENQKKKIDKPVEPIRDTARTFYTTTSGHYYEKKNKEDIPDSEGQQKRISSSSKKRILNTSDISSVQTRSTKIQKKDSLIVNILTEKEKKAVKIIEEKILGVKRSKLPFEDKTVNCSGKESIEYFRHLDIDIRKLMKKWVLAIGEESTFDNIIMKIPSEVTIPLDKINQKSQNNRELIINANNAFLVDMTVSSFMDSVTLVYDKKKIRGVDTPGAGLPKLVDWGCVMNDILSSFFEKLKNGIYLPPLDLQPVKGITNNMRRKFLSPKTGGRIITSAMIPNYLQDSLYKNFVGMKITEPWRVHNERVITYGEALEFLTGHQLSKNVYETLLLVLNTLRTRDGQILSSPVILLLWSDLERIINMYPQIDEIPNDELIQLSENLNKVATYIVIPIIPYSKGIQHMIVRIFKDTKDIVFYSPEQSNKVFGEWTIMKDYEERRRIGNIFVYIKELMEKIFGGHWCLNDVDIEYPTPPSGMDQTWPWNRKWLSSKSVPVSTDINLSPIYCTIFCETLFLGGDEEIDRYVDDIIQSRDCRYQYFQRLNNMN